MIIFNCLDTILQIYNTKPTGHLSKEIENLLPSIDSGKKHTRQPWNAQ